MNVLNFYDLKNDSQDLTNFSNNFFKTEKSARIIDLKIRIMNIIKECNKMNNIYIPRFVFPKIGSYPAGSFEENKMYRIGIAGKAKNIPRFEATYFFERFINNLFMRKFRRIVRG